VVDAEGVEHYRELRDFLKPLGVRNNMVMAYDSSATYHLDEQADVAPTEIGQFFTFGAGALRRPRRPPGHRPRTARSPV
jgi:AdoMet-dependent heme synthase